MSDKYAALKQAAQEEIMCRESGDTSDAWQDEASPECILELLAERDADRARIGSLRLTLRRLRLENADWEARTLLFTEPDRCSCVGYHIDEAYLEADPEGDCYDRDEVLAALQKSCAAAGISLKIEGE